MQPFTLHKRTAVAICLIVCCGALLTQCINRQNNETVKENPSGFQQYAGAAACAGCHKKIYDDYLHTAHYHTSAPADDQTLLGSFAPGTNSFSFSPHTTVAMEKRDSGYYQVAYADGIEKVARRFDIAIGSGTKGQTSIYWHNQQLYQLPITYFTQANQWSNSPGYPMKAVFNRTVTARCMECHSTYISVLSAFGKEPELFDSSKILYGVSCEKCHGPAAAHVAWQTGHPADTVAKYITEPKSLTRLLQLDACALCHGGKLTKTKPSFSFVPGERLADYFTFDTTKPDPDNIDLHGNQYGLLRASKCFRMSETLTCTSCHNPHEREKGNLQLFSQRCISCHNNTDTHGNGKLCKMTATLGSAITSNCIDCHMPAKPSRAIAVYLPGATEPRAALIRSHFISIYPEETKKLMEGKAGVSH